jgi:hypothetical protein
MRAIETICLILLELSKLYASYIEVVMEISSKDREILERLEEELWREETRFDLQRMNELIATDFFEFGRSGRVYQREDTLAVARQTIDAILPLPEFQVRLLDENIAQVTYNTSVTYDGAIEYARRSSIWSRTTSGWVIRFHQGTPFQP